MYTASLTGRRWRSHVGTVVAALAASACGTLSGDADVAGTGTATQPLFAASSHLWLTSAINVCWIDPRPEHATERGWVQSDADQTWGAQSALHFVGWGTCGAPLVHQIRIRQADVRESGAVGTSSYGTEVVLNFTNVASNLCTTYPSRRDCLQFVARHELGHAVGFDHEQNRADSSCPRDSLNYGGDSPIGPYDARSVMNYCAPYGGYGNHFLSDGDKLGIRQIYGSWYPNEEIFLEPRFYLEMHDDLLAAFGITNGASAAAHYRSYGRSEGRIASPVFDPGHYRAVNPDLAGLSNDALVQHWVDFGAGEGRESSPVFSVRHYLDVNPDLRAAFGSDYRTAIRHYLSYGIMEGRRASVSFDPRLYLERNSDLTIAFGRTGYARAILHYLKYGRAEGRRGAP